MKVNSKTLFIARLSILVSLTLVIQIAGLPQPFTGPLINAMLFLTTVFVGFFAGITLGFLTPLLALIRGQLPPVLAAMVPFISIGNGLLVLVFFLIFRNRFSKNNSKNWKFYIALILAAVTKFGFLFLSARILLPIVILHDIPEKIIMVMSTPQLITALAGGFIAAIFIKILQRSGVFNPQLNR